MEQRPARVRRAYAKTGQLAKNYQLRQKHTAMGDAIEQAIQQQSTFTWTVSHDQATTKEQSQEPEEGQASAQDRAKKPRTRAI